MFLRSATPTQPVAASRMHKQSWRSSSTTLQDAVQIWYSGSYGSTHDAALMATTRASWQPAGGGNAPGAARTSAVAPGDYHGASQATARGYDGCRALLDQARVPVPGGGHAALLDPWSSGDSRRGLAGGDAPPRWPTMGPPGVAGF
jgi:hypothetical protein